MSKEALFVILRDFPALLLRDVVLRGFVCLTVCLMLGTLSLINAAEYRTGNFVILAPLHRNWRNDSVTLPKNIGTISPFFGCAPMPQWSAPCSVTVEVGNSGAGGKTFFVFNDGEVFQWEMSIQGSVDSILSAVLPHEITHMIFASHFREPVPRWIDEGGATSVENLAERQNYHRKLYAYLQTGRGIPFNQMFRLADYPDDVMPLYAQGYSLTEFLIAQQGHRHFVDFAGDGMRSDDWPKAIRDYYGYENLGELQQKWVNWVAAGCPDINDIMSDSETTNHSTQRVAANTILPVNLPRVPSSNNGNGRDVGVLNASYQQSRATLVADDVSPQPLRERLSGSPLNDHQLSGYQLNDHQLSDYQTSPLSDGVNVASQLAYVSDQPLAANISPIPESYQGRQQLVVGFPRENVTSSQIPQPVFAQPVTKFDPMVASQKDFSTIDFYSASVSQTALPQTALPQTETEPVVVRPAMPLGTLNGSPTQMQAAYTPQHAVLNHASNMQPATTPLPTTSTQQPNMAARQQQNQSLQYNSQQPQIRDARVMPTVQWR